jgi:multicomponent Na+:H+ antiporter subunit D
MAGFGLKAAMMPFHAWLPDAHSSAPSPVSAVLSGVFIKTLGVYALCRIFFNVLGFSERIAFMLIALGALSMTVGAFLAIAQNDIKRMFAYSSISQVGYVVFALGIGTPLAVFAGLFHLLNHAVFKPLLFFNAGAIEYATGERRLSKLGGLGQKLPVTASAGLMGSMAISGVPPLAGFWSKLLIILAAVQARYFGFAAVAALVSVITLAYYLRFQSSVFSGRFSEGRAPVKEVPLTMKIAMVVLAVLCIVGGLMLLAPFSSFIQSAADVLLSGSYKTAVLQAVKI